LRLLGEIAKSVLRIDRNLAAEDLSQQLYRRRGDELRKMLVRHCVEESNVDEHLVVTDPTKVRHVVILAGRVESMSGLIDPASHLNL